jgi:N-acetylmuramoyl-L-alanine amidase
MTVQAANDTNGTAITFTLPAQIKYDTLSQDNGKTLIFSLPNNIIKLQTADYVTQEYIVNNRPGTALNPTGQVVHSTADPGAAAQNIRDYFNNHPDAEASTHAVIDWNSIIEMIPEDEIAWHAGPTANSQYLSFEMCEPATDDPDRNNKFQEVWNRAVWYCAKTCVKYGWNTNDNIFSHNGISKTYHETNHTDPYGYFAAYGKTWDQFLAAVDAEIAALGK